MWSGFQAKKLNTRGQLKLDHAQNQAEPGNQAGLVPGPDPDPEENFKFFFQKFKPTTMPVQHVKGQPAASTYVREKGCLKCHTNRGTPCSYLISLCIELDIKKTNNTINIYAYHLGSFYAAFLPILFIVNHPLHLLFLDIFIISKSCLGVAVLRTSSRCRGGNCQTCFSTGQEDTKFGRHPGAGFNGVRAPRKSAQPAVD